MLSHKDACISEMEARFEFILLIVDIHRSSHAFPPLQEGFVIARMHTDTVYMHPCM